MKQDSDPAPKEPDYPLYVGKYDYDRRADDDLSFKKGDLMYILHTDDQGWMLARSKETGKEGYIPSNHVAEWESLEAEKWFCNINRIEAEELLMLPPNQHGSFLVRDSETSSGGYSLTVRDKETVRNYRIKKQDDGTFTVSRRATFDTIHDLIHYYEQQADELCCVLRHPCLSQEKPRTAGLSKKANMECELNRDQIRLVGKLGASTYGEVWEGLWNATTAVAIKALKPGTSPPTEEIRHLLKLRHPKLVQVYGACTKEEPVYIVMELMKQGNLLEYLRGEGKSLELRQLINIATQVATGMAYLEEQNCAHYNLAARNILVGEHLLCKVADFGLARVIDKDIYEANTGTKFPIKWTAPETAMYNRFTIKSDVWSFGVVLYEIITYGRSPYPGMTNVQVLEALQQGYRMLRPMGCPDKLYDLMLDCWREDPASRPTFETLRWQLEEFFTSEPIFADLSCVVPRR